MRWRQGGAGPRLVCIRKNVEIRKYGQTPGCQGCHAIATQNPRSVNHSDECRKRVGSAMQDDAAGAERLDESKGRKAEGAPEPDAVMGQSSSSSSGAAAGSREGHAPRGTRRTAEDAGLPSFHDLAEDRAVQTARADMMRLGELNCEMSEVAEVFHLGRLAASRSLFDILPEVVLNLRQRNCRTSQMLGDIGGTKSNGCDRQLTVDVRGETSES